MDNIQCLPVLAWLQVRRLLQPQVDAAKSRAATTLAYGSSGAGAGQQQVSRPLNMTLP